ncbi:unnamed protein product, partial [marine sediment metagenome]
MIFQEVFISMSELAEIIVISSILFIIGIFFMRW